MSGRLRTTSDSPVRTGDRTSCAAAGAGSQPRAAQKSAADGSVESRRRARILFRVVFLVPFTVWVFSWTGLPPGRLKKNDVPLERAASDGRRGGYSRALEWCATRESNPPLKLGKLTFYR